MSDPFDTTTEVTDHGVDFSFGFNNPNYSDGVLRIEMFSEPIESTPAIAKTVHINSIVLAARSSYFQKLFSNKMKESALHDVTVQISASEEAGFMELLNFMYSSKLTVTTAPDVFDVLRAADKFQVPSCVRHCSCLLRKIPMTPESILLYLGLPSSILTAKAFQPLTVAAKHFIAVCFKHITKFKKEALGLPIASVEAIIASDDLHLDSEDAVYRFVLDWALANYPNYEERREIITTRLAKFIRFPYMTRRKLAHVLTCQEFNSDFAQKVVREALSFKAEVPNTDHTYIRDTRSILNRWFVERVYTCRPIKMIEYEQPVPGCVVYFDLKRDLCASAFPSGSVFSEEFSFGGQRFFLEAKCKTDGFGFYLVMKDRESVSFTFGYEIAAMSRRRNDFVGLRKGTCTYKKLKAIGARNLFPIPWAWFIGEDSVCFVDGVLHLRVELTELIG